MPAEPRRHRALIAACTFAVTVAGGSACGGGHGGAGAQSAKSASTFDGRVGVEVHDAGGRPRLAIVRRDGDPISGIAIELRVGDGPEEPGKIAALSAMIGARLEKGGFGNVDVTAGARFARVRALVPQLGEKLAQQIDAALITPLRGDDPAMPAVRRALDAYAARPIEEVALSAAARCLDRPTRAASYKAPTYEAVASTVEAWRVASVRADAIVIGIVGSGTGVDAFTKAWRALGQMPAQGASLASAPRKPTHAVILGGHAPEAAVLVVEGGARSAIPSALASLQDPNGPLTLRLRAADGWQPRAIAGAARPESGCVVIEVAPSLGSSSKEWNADRVTMRTAVALEVARQEIELAIEAARTLDDASAARIAIGSGGDPRDAADRAAWWGWPRGPQLPLQSTATLVVPSTLAKGPSTDTDAMLASLQTKLGLAIDRARISWARGELELKSRVEAGQGELWAALASPCGVGHEGMNDAGLANVAMNALVGASANKNDAGVTFEPWAAPTGVGVVAHAAARVDESPRALAQRVGDAIGRLLLASFPANDNVAVARAEGLARVAASTPPGELIRVALRASSPAHPSWLDVMGTFDPIAKVGLESVDLRIATLRSGPMRLAVIANVDQDQVDVAARSAERWAPRRPGESRVCPLTDPGAITKGGIHPLTVKTGTGVALAVPIEEPQREAGALLAAAFSGTGGLLATELGANGLALGWEARLVRGLGRHALVLVALAPDTNVDAVVTRLRALVERVRGGALQAADLARAERERATALLMRRLDPRGRVVDLFLGELAAPPSTIDLVQLRAVAAKTLEEERTQLVVARLAK